MITEKLAPELRGNYTLADTFTSSIMHFVYDGDKTEKELALFIDPEAMFDERGLDFGRDMDGNRVAVPHVQWVLFRDGSCAMYTIDRNVPFVGMVSDGKGSESIALAAAPADALFVE